MNFSPSFKRKVRRVVGILISIAVKVMDYLAAEYQAELKEKSSVSEPSMDPKKPGVPISYPLKTLKDLEDRSYFDSFHFPFNKSSVPLPPHRTSTPLENRPRLLVCHDMNGGYMDDKWVQGNENSEAYAIWHWHLIDIFVYFSHNLVTLPPPCWTNTAHRHGVQVYLFICLSICMFITVIGAHSPTLGTGTIYLSVYMYVHHCNQGAFTHSGNGHTHSCGARTRCMGVNTQVHPSLSGMQSF